MKTIDEPEACTAQGRQCEFGCWGCGAPLRPSPPEAAKSETFEERIEREGNYSIAHIESVWDEMVGAKPPEAAPLNPETSTAAERHIEELQARLAQAEAMARSQMSAILYTVGGTVDGHPTASINYLQRLRELVEKEAQLATAQADLKQSEADSRALFENLQAATVELEELRALTRCKYYVLTKHSGDMYAPCVLRADHAGSCATEPALAPEVYSTPPTVNHPPEPAPVPPPEHLTPLTDFANVVSHAFIRELGVNYVEMHLTAPDGKRFALTVQNRDGKTPHQMKVEAEQERDQFKRMFQQRCDQVLQAEAERDAARKDATNNGLLFEAEQAALITAVALLRRRSSECRCWAWGERGKNRCGYCQNEEAFLATQEPKP